MTNAEENTLLQAVARELVDHPAIHLILAPGDALTIVACLQLALRHPQNHGEPARIAHAVCESIIANFPPKAAALARMGFDSKYDT